MEKMTRRNKPNDIWKCLDLNPQPPSTCWLWTKSVSNKGLPYFQIGGKKVIAYRFTYWLTHPDWDINNSREVIRHGCTDLLGNHVDNPLCCRPDHLTPGTHEENMIDMMVRGRRGLNKDAVSAILDIVREGNPLDLTHEQIGRIVGAKFGLGDIPRTTVTDIINGRRRLVLRNLIDEQDRKVRESGKNGEGT